MRFVLNPLMDYYAARRASGREMLENVKGPVILVANHASHLDTPVILSALPRRLRKRTVVAAAADYFYKNRVVAWLVSLIFNTVPVRRADHRDRRRRRGDGVREDLLPERLRQPLPLALPPARTRGQPHLSQAVAPPERSGQ